MNFLMTKQVLSTLALNKIVLRHVENSYQAGALGVNWIYFHTQAMFTRDQLQKDLVRKSDQL